MNLALIIAVFFTVLSIPFSKSKVGAQIFLTFMWILWGWNTYNGDYEAYEDLYNNVFLTVSLDYEPGYKLIMALSRLIGLTFQEFFQIISLLIILLWSRYILTESRYPFFVTAIIFWCFLPLDYVLLRNSLAFSIVLQGIILLLKDTPHKRIKYVFLILIAWSFHSSSLFYLTFLLVPYISRYSRSNIIAIMIIFIAIGIFGKGYLQNIMGDAFENRTDVYESSFITFFLYSAVEIIICLILYYVSINCNHAPGHATLDFFYYTSILLLLLIPTFAIVAITIRIVRNMMMVYLIGMMNVSLRRQLYPIVPICIFLICLVFYNHFISPVSNDTITPLFFNNSIFR